MTMLKRELEHGSHFQVVNLTVNDLREIGRLREVRRIGFGELSSIILAAKLRKGFVSDDVKARRLAETQFPEIDTRTIAHLVGWLVFLADLSDSDIGGIVEDSRRLRGENGHLGRYINVCYSRAMELRLRGRVEM
jgi:hypothetical protein